MKTLVVYRSHYGSTRRYAQWLAQALDADAAEERQADARLVQNYECVTGADEAFVAGEEDLVAFHVPDVYVRKGYVKFLQRGFC